MTSLYPDESYCTSELGRLLFQAKTEWSCSAQVVAVTESKGIAGVHIDYRIAFKCTPHNSISHDERLFFISSRFRELHKLHSNLCKLHKQLYLRGSFPSFAAPRLLGSNEPSVTAERRASTDSLFSFVLDSEVLRKARILHEFVDKAVEEVPTGRSAVPDAFLYEGGNIMDAPISFENGESPPGYDTPSSGPQMPPVSQDSSMINTTSPSSDFQFPDISIGEAEEASRVPRRKSKSRLFSKLKASGAIPEGNSSNCDDYLVKAGHLVATAQRAEQEHAYELAFQCYKNAASSLIQGVEMDSDTTRRNAVRRKTAKYLMKAEKLFRTYLAYDGSVFNIDDILTSSMQDPNLLAFRCANQSLKNYEVIGVLPSVDAPRIVLLVQEKASGHKLVIKLLEKGNISSGGRILLPTNAPHMIQLQQFFETETHVLLLLEYVETGQLWKFLDRYFGECENSYMTSVLEGEEMIIDGVRIEKKQGMKTFDSSSYTGRRLLFSVGMDFERVAGMRDELQSTDDPSSTGILCTMGEDATGQANVPAGDFYLVGDTVEHLDCVALSVEEEAPASLNIIRDVPEQPSDKNTCLAHSLSEVRYLLRSRRPMWPSHNFLPSALIVHWTAQIISWLYVMHSEYEEYIGDLIPEDILINVDGNILITYYGVWHSKNRPKRFTQGYSAPECFCYDWVPNPANDIWTLGSILFELLTGRSLANAALHGVNRFSELPFPEHANISLSAKDLCSMLLLVDPVDRASLEDIRAHPFYSTIDWSLYDNPHQKWRNSAGSTSSSSSNLKKEDVEASGSLAPEHLIILPDSLLANST